LIKLTPVYQVKGELKHYLLMWDFAPSCTPKHMTIVVACSLEEAFETLKKEIGENLDIWEY
jgi:hypothetical protein